MFTDETNEENDSVNVQEEAETETTTSEESEEETQEEAKTTDWEAEAKKLRAILERKSKKVEKKPAPATQSVETVEEIVLRTQGMEDDLIEPLKKLAKINGQTLVEAQKDPLFIALKEKREAEKKSQEASMGAARGSAQKSPKISFNTPGITDAQHKELWKKTMGL